MSWVTAIWSSVVGVCLTLGTIHLVVWCWNRALLANLWFAGGAFSIAAVAVFEWLLMHAWTPAEYLAWHRWGHVAVFFAVASIIGFVQWYFQTGRVWLAWTVIALRALVVVLGFVPGPTFNFREITSLVPFKLFGETVAAPIGVPSPWAHLGESSVLLLTLFFVDAALRLWRKGGARERQRALVVGGGVVLWILGCLTNSFLVHSGLVPAPYFVSFTFLFVLVAMGIELCRDLLGATRMTEALRENAESIRLAAGAAQLALWRWDIPHDVVWLSPNGCALYGLPPENITRFQCVLDVVHGDDREPLRQRVRHALEGGGELRAEYRVVLPDGVVRWIGTRGKLECNKGRESSRMRGVSIDVTERKTAELEAEQRRAELVHLTRVATLSELSGSLAHELDLPLAIILSNAQAAQRLLAQSPPDVAEVRDILTDIVGENRRAGKVIQRLRGLLKRGETVSLPVPVNDTIEDVLHLIQSDLIGRGVVVARGLADGLHEVKADRVQLQQVILNLILNGADAMSANADGARRIRVSTTNREGGVRVSVRDEGCGLPADVEKIFQPFFTTKPQGLGLGLAICRAIIAAHGGKLWAESHPEGGAVFHFELPARLTPDQ